MYYALKPSIHVQEFEDMQIIYKYEKIATLGSVFHYEYEPYLSMNPDIRIADGTTFSEDLDDLESLPLYDLYDVETPTEIDYTVYEHNAYLAKCIVNIDDVSEKEIKQTIEKLTVFGCKIFGLRFSNIELLKSQLILNIINHILEHPKQLQFSTIEIVNNIKTTMSFTPVFNLFNKIYKTNMGEAEYVNLDLRFIFTEPINNFKGIQTVVEGIMPRAPAITFIVLTDNIIPYYHEFKKYYNTNINFVPAKDWGLFMSSCEKMAQCFYYEDVALNNEISIGTQYFLYPQSKVFINKDKISSIKNFDEMYGQNNMFLEYICNIKQNTIGTLTMSRHDLVNDLMVPFDENWKEQAVQSFNKTFENSLSHFYIGDEYLKKNFTLFTAPSTPLG